MAWATLVALTTVRRTRIPGFELLIRVPIMVTALAAFGMISAAVVVLMNTHMHRSISKRSSGGGSGGDAGSGVGGSNVSTGGGGGRGVFTGDGVEGVHSHDGGGGEPLSSSAKTSSLSLSSAFSTFVRWIKNDWRLILGSILGAMAYLAAGCILLKSGVMKRTITIIQWEPIFGAVILSCFLNCIAAYWYLHFHKTNRTLMRMASSIILAVSLFSFHALASLGFKFYYNVYDDINSNSIYLDASETTPSFIASISIIMIGLPIILIAAFSTNGNNLYALIDMNSLYKKQIAQQEADMIAQRAKNDELVLKNDQMTKSLEIAAFSQHLSHLAHASCVGSKFVHHPAAEALALMIHATPLPPPPAHLTSDLSRIDIEKWMDIPFTAASLLVQTNSEHASDQCTFILAVNFWKKWFGTAHARYRTCAYWIRETFIVNNDINIAGSLCTSILNSTVTVTMFDGALEVCRNLLQSNGLARMEKELLEPSREMIRLYQFRDASAAAAFSSSSSSSVRHQQSENKKLSPTKMKSVSSPSVRYYLSSSPVPPPPPPLPSLLPPTPASSVLLIHYPEQQNLPGSTSVVH